MNFIEKTRKSEPHADSILVIFLQDANGAPVANQKIKVYAGPPPSGEPAYFTDDDPNNPNRRTDVNGRFQFSVAGGVPDARLDFFCRVMDNSDQPASAPIPFPFPAGLAQWIIVTLAADATSANGGGTAPPVTAPEIEAGSMPEKPEDAAATTLPPRTGNVRGNIANAAAGARLVLRTTGRMNDALVASDGTYSFNNVPVGTYTLELAGVGVINPALTVVANQTVSFDYPVASAAPSKKIFKHYLLFGPGSQPGTMTNLILALDYIVHYAPTVGFLVDEASNAERVTIVGGTGAVTAQDEQRLRDGGCRVSRLQAADSYALENIFQQLLASGSPFLP